MKVLVSILILVSSLPICSQMVKEDEALSILKEPALEGALVGISIVNLTTNQSILKQHAQIRMVPASTQKLFTAKTALDILGSNYQFETELRYSGRINSDGILEGDIVWKGSGDPVLGDEKFKDSCSKDSIFQNILVALKDDGISEIQGQIIIINEQNQNDYPLRYWLWEDISNYYGARAQSFNFMGNEYEILFSRKNRQLGDHVKILSIDPLPPGIELFSEVNIGESGSGDQAYVFGGPMSSHQVVKGTIPPGKNPFKIRAAIHHPGALAGALLIEFLSNNGIPVKGGYQVLHKSEQEQDFQKRILLYRHKSPILDEIVSYLLMKSDNLIAEALLHKLSFEIKHISSSKITSILTQSVGKDQDITQSWSFYDGSGLSPLNRISPDGMGAFLRFQYTQKDFLEWLNTIPNGNQINGADRYVQNFKCLINLHIKTGSMNNIQNYAGYMQTNSGDILSVVAFFSDFKCKRSEIKKTFYQLVSYLFETS